MESGEVISVIALDDATQVRRPVPFTAGFPNAIATDDVPTCVALDLDPLTASGALHDVFRAVQQSLEAVLQGYHVPDELTPARTRALVAALFTVTVDPKLPLFQMRGCSFVPLSYVPFLPDWPDSSRTSPVSSSD